MGIIADPSIKLGRADVLVSVLNVRRNAVVGKDCFRFQMPAFGWNLGLVKQCVILRLLTNCNLLHVVFQVRIRFAQLEGNAGRTLQTINCQKN